MLHVSASVALPLRIQVPHLNSSDKPVVNLTERESTGIIPLYRGLNYINGALFLIMSRAEKIHPSTNPSLRTTRTDIIGGRTAFVGDSRYARFSAQELIRRNIETERFEMIDTHSIALEAAIVDEAHVKGLAKSMKTKRGQISPITVRARDAGNGKVHYDIIDGFHRTEGFLANGMKTAKAVVLYGCSDEELYDLRVLAAKSVASVRFARVASWMRGSFEQTKWAKKGLKISQIFSLTVFSDTQGAKEPGKRLGISVEEAAEAIKWANDKADAWTMPVATVWETVRTVEAAAPDLVMKVRTRGGHKGKGSLTQARLTAIVSELPGLHDLQRDVAKIVLTENLPAEYANILAHEIKEALEAKDQDKIDRILVNPYSVLGETAYSSGGGFRAESQSGQKQEGVIFKANHGKSEGKQTNGSVILKQENKELREQLAKITSQLRESHRQGLTQWWNTFPDLDDNERTALQLVLGQGLDLQLAALKMKLSTEVCLQYIQNGFRRYIGFIKEEEQE